MTWKTFLTGSLSALAAMFEWHQVHLVAQLSSFIFALVENKMHSLVKEI
jgi:hypothetical protein